MVAAIVSIVTIMILSLDFILHLAQRSAIQAILARHFRRVLVMEQLKVAISILCGAHL
jgi:hypothetical protein